MNQENIFINNSIARLPTIFGEFAATAFVDENAREHFALIKGSKNDGEIPLVRIHSECLTGDVFGSKKCDCQMQLHKSLELIAKEDYGILLYLRQEGRGIGLANKIRAYALQDKGLDTVEANNKLGFNADERSYLLAAKILSFLQVSKIRLITNNPEKISCLQENGVKVLERIPVIVGKTVENGKYLETKKKKMGHLL